MAVGEQGNTTRHSGGDEPATVRASSPSGGSAFGAGGPTRVAVFVSGGGRTLANLLERIDRGELAARVVLVCASKECRAAEIARTAGVEVDIRSDFANAEAVAELLAARRVEWVVLAGYVRYLPIPEKWAGRIVNIHPSLLPRHGGRGMYGERVHAAVLAAGDRESGCTVHLVDEVYDRGRVLGQRRCMVEPGDTPARLGARVFELEKDLYPRVLAELFADARERR